MRKNPFLIFALVTGILTLGLIWFIQSPDFAGIFKRIAVRYIPADLGIEGDFSEFAIRLFPPSVSIRNPKVVFHERNVVDLPAGSRISAERLDLVFLPFQMFSGDISVNQVRIVNGDVRLAFDRQTATKKSAHKKTSGFKWDELLKVHVEGIALENTRVSLKMAEPEFSADFTAKELTVGQWSGTGGMGYELAFEFAGLDAVPPGSKARISLDSLKAKARVNPLALKLDEFSMKRLGLQLDMTGSIRGNVMEGKNLPLEATVKMQGELAQVLQVVLGKKDHGSLPVGGEIKADGVLRASAERLLDTLQFQGSARLLKPRFQSWTADEVSLEGGWSAGDKDGELNISKAVISGRESQRDGANHPGFGGQIEVGAFHYRPGSMAPLEVPLKFSRAHLHWLAAPGAADVYALTFRVSGPSKVVFTPGDEWRLTADVDFGLDEFQLDNQRLGKVKPLHRVLKIPHVGLSGRLVVDKDAVRPDEMTLKLPNSKFTVSGKVDFTTGYDLRASGDVDLKDVGTIADNEIRGQGKLATHVHGLPARVFVDFDADVKDAYYIGLNLGDLRGRITWDDDPSHLIFSSVDVSQGKTRYNADGKFDLGDAETVNMKVAVPQGTVQDFMKIFDGMTKDLWWFPRSLDGETSGTIKVSGGIRMDQLEVAANMRGSAWEYFGERFRSVQLEGGYDKGRYYIDSLKALKHFGSLSGMISYDAQRNFNWDLRTENLSVSDIDHVARLDVPMRGRIVLLSAGHGKEGAIESVSRAALMDFRVRGDVLPSSEAVWRTANGVAAFNGSVFGGQGLVDLLYDFKLGAKSMLRMQASSLDFSPLLLILNPRGIHDRQLAGSITGMFDLGFRTGEVERGTGRMEISEYILRKTGLHFQLAKEVSSRIDGGTFDFNGVTFAGNQGRVTLNLRGRSAQIEGNVAGDFDLSVLEFLTPSIAQASGLTAVDLSIGGQVKEPVFFGKTTLRGGMIKVHAVDPPFENLVGAIQLRQNVVTVQGVEAEFADGRARADGTIQLFADRYPKIELNGVLSGNKLKIYPFQVAKVRGRLTVAGERIPYLVQGALMVDNALSREKIMTSGSGPALKSAQYTPSSGRIDERDAPKFKLDLNVNAERNIIVQNDLLDAELKANVKIVNTIDTPRVLGAAELVQGRLVFKDRVFQLQSAKVDFDNPTVINPAFSMTALTDVNNTKIQMFASGRMDKYKIEFMSQPVLPEAEILSLLALGLTTEEVKKLKTSDRGAFEQSEAASLVLHSLDFNRDVQDKTGLQIQIDGVVDTQTGTSVFRPRNESDTSAAPKIVIKRQIGDRVDVSVGSTVGMGTGQQKEVNAEVKLWPGVSLIGVWDSKEGVDSQNNRTSSGSYGVDFKAQTRFK